METPSHRRHIDCNSPAPDLTDVCRWGPWHALQASLQPSNLRGVGLAGEQKTNVQQRLISESLHKTPFTRLGGYR